MSGLRVGLGYDMHAFAESRRLVLGGVEIPGDVGLLGHSDADVLVHALMDAILGAMRAGDIGEHFPDTDPAYADISSLDLLEAVGGMMASSGWKLIDADMVLVLERPKVAPFRNEMRQNIATRLNVPIDSIGLKATTTEGLGATGRGEGAAAQAVVLIERS